MRLRGHLALALIAGLQFLATGAGQGQAPWFGTWRLNPDKSSGSANGSRYKRVTTRIESRDGGLKVTYDMVGLRGGVIHMEWNGKFDGKDYPVQGVDYVLTNAYSPIDDHSYRIEIKVDGQTAALATVEITPDGQTLKTTTKEKVQGRETVSTAVYERQ